MRSEPGGSEIDLGGGHRRPVEHVHAGATLEHDGVVTARVKLHDVEIAQPTDRDSREHVHTARYRDARVHGTRIRAAGVDATRITPARIHPGRIERARVEARVGTGGVGTASIEPGTRIESRRAVATGIQPWAAVEVGRVDAPLDASVGGDDAPPSAGGDERDRDDQADHRPYYRRDAPKCLGVAEV